jgi:hypothetical protein
MAVTKVLARGFKWEVNTGTIGVPVWTQVNGLTQIGTSAAKEDADTTDFASAGWGEHMVAQRGMQYTLEGFFLEDKANGTRDAGQLAVETAAEAVGESSLSQFRYTTPGGKIRSFMASVETSFSGAKNDPVGWSATLTLSGTITKVN